MRLRLLCISLALTSVAEAAEPEPCTAPRSGAWVEMPLADGPQLSDIADVKTGFLVPSKWWLWDAIEPLTQSRVFDVRCNTWRRTALAEGTRLPRQLDRRYGVLFGDNELAVHAPTWETAKDGSLEAGPMAVFVLDGERLQWANVAQGRPPISHDAQVIQGDGLLFFWDERTGSGAIFTLATKRWEAFTARPPFMGKGHDCSWIQGGTWLVANPTGVFRLDLGSKAWVTVLKAEKPFLPQDLGACLRIPSAGGLSTVMPKSLYAPQRVLFAIDGAATGAWEIPWEPGGGDPHVIAAGGTVWHKDNTGAGQLRRYDRGARKWVPAVIPKGLDARAVFISELQGQAMLVELPPPVRQPQAAMPRGSRARPVAPAPKPVPMRVALWNGKSFGRPITLGPVDALRDEVQAALEGLVAIDRAAIRVLDTSGKERLRFPSPPAWRVWRGFSLEAFVTWGVAETAVGNDCHNPFRPRDPDPTLPVCDPSREIVYMRPHPGGFMLLRAPGEAGIKK